MNRFIRGVIVKSVTNAKIHALKHEASCSASAFLFVNFSEELHKKKLHLTVR